MAYCSCPKALLTSNMAPTHPHAMKCPDNRLNNLRFIDHYWQKASMMHLTTCRSKHYVYMCKPYIFIIACYTTLHSALSVHRSVGPLVDPLVGLSHYFFLGLWPHCSCPNDKVTSIMAPAHPHATGVAKFLVLLVKSEAPRVNIAWLFWLLVLQ